MSKEMAKKFLEKAIQNEELNEQLQRLYEKNESLLHADIMELAARNGFEFKVDDLQQVLMEITKQSQSEEELDDLQLEAIAGGDIAAEGARIINSITSFFQGCYRSHENKSHGSFKIGEKMDCDLDLMTTYK